MPLEVTPIPFADQQLPYTPKFQRPELDALLGSNAGSVLSGPASVQSNAIIPPSSGGMAGPHRAIAALPEAGYTAPSVPPINIPIPRGHPAPPPSLSAGSIGANPRGPPSIYAGGSMYEGAGPALPARAPIYTDGWASSSLPEPKQAPFSPQSEIFRQDPHFLHQQRPREEHHPYDEENHHQYHHHHHHHHYDTHDRRDKENVEQEKRHRHRSNDINDAASADGSYYARPRLSRRRSDSISSAGGHETEYETAPHHHRYSSIHLTSKTQHQGHSSTNPYSNPVPMSNSHSPRENRVPISAASALGRSPSRGHMHEASSPLGKTPIMLPTRGNAPSSISENKGGRVPPPIDRQASPAMENVRDREDRRSRHHRGRSSSFIHQEPSPSLSPPGHNANLLAVETPRRRRAISMHELEQPLDEIFHHQRSQPFGSPTEFYEPQTGAFDDRASIAGSALTFLDGSIGGRVSQYGLPKYAHRPKPDYRRFCVQRGNADVYLD